MKQIFEEKNRLPEAIVCANDAIAYRLLDVLEEKGYNIPKDIKISGFDDIEEGKYLTSVRINAEEIGARLAEQIIWRISHPVRNYEVIKIIGEVIYRGST